MHKHLESRLFHILLGTLVISAWFIAEDAYARAGGGSSGGGSNRGGGIAQLLAYAAAAIWSVVLAYIVHRKNRQCKILLEKISKQDEAWSPAAIKARIEETYFMVQQAWKERNQDLARQYMSDRLYQKHKLQTDNMLRDGHKPMMFAINLKKASIVEILDFEDNSKDQFCAHIEGSMTDYVINERTKEHVSGDANNASFKELWRFIRSGNTWVLDEIDQSVSASELLNMVARKQP